MIALPSAAIARVSPKAYALALTMLVCGLIECLIIGIFWAKTGSFLAGFFYSFFLFGPVSVWVGPPLYRHICETAI